MARRVLVSGANRGLGLEFARQMIAAGDDVWGSAREAEPAALLALGPTGSVVMDMGDEASVVAGVQTLGEQIDGLDLLINCAGLDGRGVGASEDARGPFDFDAHTFTEVMRINATGPMMVTREAIPLLRNGQNATVVNISSQLGSMEVAATKGRDTAYCVSKAALNMVTVKTAAAVATEGIKVISMHPGWASTDMGGSGADISPEASVSGMVSVIGGLTASDNGRFLNWNGTTHPW